MLRHACIDGDPQCQARGAKSEVIFNKREQNQNCLPQACLFGGQKEGGNAMPPLHSPGSPTPSAGSKITSGPQQKGNKTKNGCLTPVFCATQKSTEMLRHACINGDPQCQARGAKSEVVPNKREQNHKW